MKLKLSDFFTALFRIILIFVMLNLKTCSMKRFKVALLSVAIFALSASTYAQLTDVDFLKGGIDDAKPLFESYLGPYANIFGANLNAAWYNTAKPHKLGGFDLTVTFNTAWAPVADRTFDLSTLGLNGSIIGDPITSTVAGKKITDRPSLRYTETVDLNGTPTDITLAEYKVPNGTGINMIPLPMAQLGIGLPFGTDVSVRYLPTLDLGNFGSIGLWGVGGKHSIIQHIPGLKHLPVIDISVQGGYTKLTTLANLNYGPDKIANATDLTTDPTVFDDQKVQFTAGAWTINLIASQTLPVITFYQGIGYSSSVIDFGLKGSYPFPEVDVDPVSPHFGELVVTDNGILTDPELLNFEMKNNKDLRLNAGFRIKLGVLTIHFDYTKANYSVFTSGIGVSFR